MEMIVFFLLLFANIVAYHTAWFYGWYRLGRVAPEERCRLDVPNPWVDFSYELFAFTASRCFLRISDRAARRAFGFTLISTPVSFLLLLAFWLTL
jgi:hypothetical protein